MSDFRIALKVDCDTAVGTRRGIPRLLEIFGRHGIRASFFFSLGPDRSGRAALRVFTRKGFARKMLRSRAASLYPMRTMLSGTVLPAPEIGRFARREIAAAAAAGHECGVHAWDHVGWHDRLERWTEERIAREYARLHDAFREIVGEDARCSAAPGWTVNDRYLHVRERYPLRYTSDTRGGRPFFPLLTGVPSAIVEVPSTLPTLDEALGDPRHPSAEALFSHFRDLPSAGAASVHTIHTEVEGGPHADWFDRLLAAWRERGAEFVTVGEVAAAALSRRRDIPVRPVRRIRLPGRAGTVATGTR